MKIQYQLKAVICAVALTLILLLGFREGDGSSISGENGSGRKARKLEWIFNNIPVYNNEWYTWYGYYEIPYDVYKENDPEDYIRNTDVCANEVTQTYSKENCPEPPDCSQVPQWWGPAKLCIARHPFPWDTDKFYISAMMCKPIWENCDKCVCGILEPKGIESFCKYWPEQHQFPDDDRWDVDCNDLETIRVTSTGTGETLSFTPFREATEQHSSVPTQLFSGYPSSVSSKPLSPSLTPSLLPLEDNAGYKCVGNRLQHSIELPRGQYLCAVNGNYRLGMTFEGFFIYLDVLLNKTVVLNPRESAKGSYFKLHDNAKLVIRNEMEKTVWSRKSSTLVNDITDQCLAPYDCPHLYIQEDGIVVLQWMEDGIWLKKNINELYNGKFVDLPRSSVYCPGGDSNDLEVIAKDPTCLLNKCQGDCDTDEDCAGNLSCYQRNGGSPGPQGCSGTAESGFDYCYYNKR